MATIERNEAGDRFDGLKDTPLPAPPKAPPRGLPPGAIGFNAAGDPVFPALSGDRNEAGDLKPEALAAVAEQKKEPCDAPRCQGRGRWMEQDPASRVKNPIVCQKCNGTGINLKVTR